MVIRASALVAALIFALPSAGAAQAPITVGAPASNVLRAGTSVHLRTLTNLTTQGKKLKTGERVQLEVSEAVTMNGQVVIPVGAHAVGEVTSVRNKGMWGKSGNIDARLVYLEVGSRQIRISGTITDKGVTGTAGVVGAAVLIPVAGFFLTGTSAVIPPGTPVNGFLDEDVPVSFIGGATGSSAPLVVQSSPSAATPVGLVQASAVKSK